LTDFIYNYISLYIKYVHITFFPGNRCANYKNKYDSSEHSLHKFYITYLIIVHTFITIKLIKVLMRCIIYMCRILQKNFRVAENLIKFEINLVYFYIR